MLDQFEQWLHAKKDEENTELVQALRQCDGGRVQCVVMVRDDFWHGSDSFHGRTRNPSSPRATTSPRSICSTCAMPVKCWRLLAELLAALPDNSTRTHDGTKRLPRSGSVRSGPGWQSHLGAAGLVRGDGEGQAVDARHAQRSRRHRRRRRYLPRRYFHASTANPRASLASEGGPGGSESPAARMRHGHQRPHALAARIARSIGLWQSPEGLRRPCSASSTAKFA